MRSKNDGVFEPEVGSVQNAIKREGLSFSEGTISRLIDINRYYVALGTWSIRSAGFSLFLKSLIPVLATDEISAILDETTLSSFWNSQEGKDLSWRKNLTKREQLFRSVLLLTADGGYFWNAQFDSNISMKDWRAQIRRIELFVLSKLEEERLPELTIAPALVESVVAAAKAGDVVKTRSRGRTNSVAFNAKKARAVSRAQGRVAAVYRLANKHLADFSSVSELARIENLPLQFQKTAGLQKLLVSVISSSSIEKAQREVSLAFLSLAKNWGSFRQDFLDLDDSVRSGFNDFSVFMVQSGARFFSRGESWGIGTKQGLSQRLGRIATHMVEFNKISRLTAFDDLADIAKVEKYCSFRLKKQKRAVIVGNLVLAIQSWRQLSEQDSELVKRELVRMGALWADVEEYPRFGQIMETELLSLRDQLERSGAWPVRSQGGPSFPERYLRLVLVNYVGQYALYARKSVDEVTLESLIDPNFVVEYASRNPKFMSRLLTFLSQHSVEIRLGVRNCRDITRSFRSSAALIRRKKR